MLCCNLTINFAPKSNTVDSPGMLVQTLQLAVLDYSSRRKYIRSQDTVRAVRARIHSTGTHTTQFAPELHPLRHAGITLTPVHTARRRAGIISTITLRQCQPLTSTRPTHSYSASTTKHTVHLYSKAQRRQCWENTKHTLILSSHNIIWWILKNNDFRIRHRWPSRPLQGPLPARFKDRFQYRITLASSIASRSLPVPNHARYQYRFPLSSSTASRTLPVPLPDRVDSKSCEHL